MSVLLTQRLSVGEDRDLPCNGRAAGPSLPSETASLPPTCLELLQSTLYSLLDFRSSLMIRDTRRSIRARTALCESTLSLSDSILEPVSILRFRPQLRTWKTDQEQELSLAQCDGISVDQPEEDCLQHSCPKGSLVFFRSVATPNSPPSLPYG